MSLLEVKGLTKRFGGITAVDDVSISVNENEIVGLIGPNGAGKSTLVQMLMKIIKPNRGQIFFRGREITRLSTWDIVEQGLAGTFQTTRPFRHLPVFANVMVPSAVSSTFRRCEKQAPLAKCMQVLDSVGLAHLAKQPALNLSHGDLKRLEIARALATDPELMILDEPFGGLNNHEIQQLSELLKNLNAGLSRPHGKRLTMIIIEHKLSELMKIVDRVIVLYYGKVLATGTPEEIVKNEAVIEGYIGKEVI